MSSKWFRFLDETIPDVNPTGKVICWGSVSMDHVAQLKGWKPGTFLNENFDQRIWTAKYKDYILNADAEFYEFSKIPAFTGMKFIRPVSDMKIFSGKCRCILKRLRTGKYPFNGSLTVLVPCGRIRSLVSPA